MNEHDFDTDDTDDLPSKSARKRQSLDLQALGEALIELSEEELQALPLPETLYDAVKLAQRITAHGGLYRQKQYIGKLMRKIDAEPIRAAIEARRNSQRASAVQFKRIEQWRNRLLTEGTPAVDAFLQEHPDANAAQLKRLLDQAQWERNQHKPPQAARELFTVIKELTCGGPGVPG